MSTSPNEALIAQLPPGVNDDTHWFIKFHGIEWSYVLFKLIEKCIPKVDGKDLPVLFVMNEGQPMYLIQRQHLSAETLSRYVGLDVEALKASKVVELAVKPRPDLPKPTVEGWGEA